MDSILFYIALFVHLSSLILGFGSVMVVDSFGLLWLMKRRSLAQVMKVADITQRLIWIGWCGLVASGLILITLKGYVDNLTKIKLFFVLLLGLNGIYLHFIKKSMDRLGEHDMVPKLLVFRSGLASAISQTGWWGALFIGFVHRHIEHTINWPANPYLYIGIIAGAFLIGGIAGELAFRQPSASAISEK